MTSEKLKTEASKTTIIKAASDLKEAASKFKD
jgi:hypothetical protein